MNGEEFIQDLGARLLFCGGVKPTAKNICKLISDLTEEELIKKVSEKK